VDELIRSKMHDALDVEQPDGGLRSRIMSSLPADGLGGADRSGVGSLGRRTELMAAIAALVLAAIVVGTFAYIRSVTSPHLVTPPITSPSPGVPIPTPTLTQSLNVSASTPVILFNDAGNSNQVDGMTWDGRAGKLTEIAAQGQSVCQTTATTQVCSPPPFGGGAPPLGGPEASSPNGTLFVAIPYFYDRSGHVVATLTGPPYSDYPNVGIYFVGTWADDDHHYCQVQPQFGGATAVTGTLQLTTPGGAPRNVVHIGSQAASENTLTVGACSMLADRAVLVQAATSGSGGNTIDQYWVVQLSSGHVLWTRDLRGAGVASVIASRDGRYVAEVPTTGATTIYGPTGSVVAHVNGLVEAFSWDGSLAVVVANGGASVVRWNDGTVVWTVPAGEGLSGFQPEPGGTNFAIRTVNGTLYVVSSAGHVIAQRDIPGLLGCIPAQCASSAFAQAQQVLPTVMVGDVGWTDGPQRTTDGGLHWKDASPPNPANRTKGGYTNYFLDANHAWVTVATGDQPLQNATKLVVFSTADGGQTWTQGSVPISGVVSETARLDFIDPQHGWLIIDSGPYALDKGQSIGTQPVSRAVYSTTDGGLNWSRLATAQQGDSSALGTLAVGCSMSGLTFMSLKDGWLTWDCNSGIGSAPPQTTGSQVTVTHDGGRSWQPVTLPSFPTNGAYICSVYAPVFTGGQGALSVFCGGTGGPGFSAIYTTTDAGRTWTFRKIPFFTQQMEFTDANTGWASASTGATLYRTTNGGRDWTVLKQFASEQHLDFRFVDSRNGFALTSRFAADGKSGYSTMWKTTDGGQTWSVMSTVPTGARF
jgi:photosystem II stability/assembly factor-like uncharacterized protein